MSRVKLSLMVPTFRSAETIERTLGSVLAQRYRPLEVLVYDEASADGTRELVEARPARAPIPRLETEFLTSDENSGPGDRLACPASCDHRRLVRVRLGRRRSQARLQREDDGGRRSRRVGWTQARRLLRARSRADGTTGPTTPSTAAWSSGADYSEASSCGGCRSRRSARCTTSRRHAPCSSATSASTTRAARLQPHPYGNDVGFLSELAAEGGGVELLGERLVTLVDSSSSMTRRGRREHIWQMRWQYTFNHLRVWSWWADRGVPGAGRLRRLGERRLALCSIMLGATAHVYAGELRRLGPGLCRVPPTRLSAARPHALTHHRD